MQSELAFPIRRVMARAHCSPAVASLLARLAGFVDEPFEAQAPCPAPIRSAPLRRRRTVLLARRRRA
jgi:hypothetical protein